MTVREKVLAFATKAHAGQKRRDGKDYITHPIAVAEIAGTIWSDTFGGALMPDDLYVVAILHDVLEDCDVTFEDLHKEFDYWTARQVDMLTKREGENYLESIMRIVSFITIIIKIADNTHNMSDLKEGSLKDKYRLSKYILEQKL